MLSIEPVEVAGGCYCGAITLRSAAERISVVNCHCGQCRALGGSAFTTWVSLSKSNTTVSGKEHLREFNPTPNCKRYFCGTCGVHVFTEDLRMPHVVGVPAGILGSSLTRQPTEHYFMDHKAEWHAVSDNLPQFGGSSGMERIDV